MKRSDYAQLLLIPLQRELLTLIDDRLAHLASTHSTTEINALTANATKIRNDLESLERSLAAKLPRTVHLRRTELTTALAIVSSPDPTPKLTPRTFELLLAAAHHPLDDDDAHSLASVAATGRSNP